MTGTLEEVSANSKHLLHQLRQKQQELTSASERIRVLEDALRNVLSHLGPGGYIPGCGKTITDQALAALHAEPDRSGG